VHAVHAAVIIQAISRSARKEQENNRIIAEAELVRYLRSKGNPNNDLTMNVAFAYFAELWLQEGT
jgi:hypothetical protein